MTAKSAQVVEMEQADMAIAGDATDDNQVITTTGDPLLRMIEQTLVNPELDVEKLERLFALYEKSQARQAEIDFDADLAEMQGVLPVIEEHGSIKNGAGVVQSTYAYWADIKAAIQPFMREHGFGITHTIDKGPDGITVTGILSHRSGHKRLDAITLPHDSSGSKNAVQAVGSSNMYGRRYTAQNLIGFSTKGDRADDGGQKAPGDGPMISADQQEQLKLLCFDGEIEVKKFLGYFKVNAFNQIPAAKFEDVKGILETRVADRKAARRREAEAAAEGSAGK